MRIDDWLPEYDATAVRAILIEAPAEVVYDAILKLDLSRCSKIVDILNWLRILPERLSHLLHREPMGEAPDQLTWEDILRDTPWIGLSQDPGRELVIGAVGKFWRPVIDWVEVDPAEFADFDEPGFARLAVAFTLRPQTDDRTLLTYESRTWGTDQEASRKFLRYWKVIGPFAGLMMRQALDVIKADAEAAVPELSA